MSLNAQTFREYTFQELFWKELQWSGLQPARKRMDWWQNDHQWASNPFNVNKIKVNKIVGIMAVEHKP